MDVTLAVLVVHAFASVFMVGLIWTIQLVHYPLFARVGEAEFGTYISGHTRRITWIVGPVMLAELASAVLLVFAAGIDGGVRTAAWAGLAILGIIWLSTFVAQGPMNLRLCAGRDERLIARLVATNWLRTALWSGRGVMAMIMLVRFVSEGAAR